MQCRIKDPSYLTHIIGTLNEKSIPDHTELVFLDIVNIFSGIGNQRRMQAVLDIV